MGSHSGWNFPLPGRARLCVQQIKFVELTPPAPGIYGDMQECINKKLLV